MRIVTMLLCLAGHRWGPWVAVDNRPSHDIMLREEIRSCGRCNKRQARNNVW